MSILASFYSLSCCLDLSKVITYDHFDITAFIGLQPGTAMTVVNHLYCSKHNCQHLKIVYELALANW